MTEQEEPIIIRASTLTAYADCSLRAVVSAYPFLFKNAGFQVRQLKANIAAAVGTGSHSGIAHSLATKIESGKLAPESESIEAGIESFNQEVKEGVSTDKITPNKNVAHWQIKRIVQAFGTVGYRMTPLASEQRYNARLASVPGFEMSGRFDLIDQLSPEKFRMLDLKTGRSLAPFPYQIGLYSVIAEANKEAIGVSEISACGELRIPRSGEREEQPDPEFKIYDLEHAKQMGLSVYKRIAKDIMDFEKTGDPGLSFMANPWSNMCRETTCGAWGTPICSLWSKKKED